MNIKRNLLEIHEVEELKCVLTQIRVNPSVELASCLEQMNKIDSLVIRDLWYRRELLWEIELHIWKIECFVASEGIIWHFAINESETIANNATELWRSLWSVSLSATQVPFSERLELLKLRLLNANDREWEVAVRGLRSAISVRGSSRVIFVKEGEEKPEFWKPRTNDEAIACYKTAFDTVRWLKEMRPDMSRQICDVLLKEAAELYLVGFANDVLPLIDFEGMPLEQRQKAIAAANNAIWRAKHLNRPLPNHMLALESWLDQVVRDRLLYRMISLFTSFPKDPGSSEKQLDQRIHDMASELLCLETLDSELKWLVEQESITARDFGIALGSLDFNTQKLFDRMSKPILPISWLVAGYFMGICEQGRKGIEIVKGLLEKTSVENTEFAYGIAFYCRSYMNAVEIACDLVEQGRLPAHYLQNFAVPKENDIMSDVKRCITLIFAGMKKAKRSFKAAQNTLVEEIERVRKTKLTKYEKDTLHEKLLSCDKFERLLYDLSRPAYLFDDASEKARSEVFDGAKKAGVELWQIANAIFEYLHFRLNKDSKQRDQILNINKTHESIIMALGILSSGIHMSYQAEVCIDAAATRNPEKTIRVIWNNFVQGNALEDLLETNLAKIAQHSPKAVIAELLDRIVKKPNAPYLIRGDLGSVIEALGEDHLIPWLEKTGLIGARAIAYHLPLPDFNGDIPLHIILRFVVDKFGTDKIVKSRILSGTINRKGLFTGPISDYMHREATGYRKVAEGELGVVREWAEDMATYYEENAKMWKKNEDRSEPNPV